MPKDIFQVPRSTTSATPEPLSRVRLNQALASANGSGEGSFRFIPAILILLVVVLLILGGIYFLRSRELAPNTEEAPSFFERLLGTPENSGPSTTDDMDRDGLDDKEESAAGTDAASADTDGDGLNDREETLVYKTDPRQKDSDGDNTSDGDEIRQRRDPKNSNPDAEWPPRPSQFSTATN